MPFPIYGYLEFMPEDNFPFKIEIRTQNAYNLVSHAHEHFQLCYMAYGTCIHRIGDKEEVMVQGSFFTIPSFIEHQILPIQGIPFEIIQIDFMPFFIHESLRDLPNIRDLVDFAWIQPLIETSGVPIAKMNFSFKDKLEVETRIASMRKELENKEMGYKLAIKADLLKILILTGRTLQKNQQNNKERKTYSTQSFYQTIAYMEQHFKEDIRLDDMAELAHISPTYYSSIFKLLKVIGFSDYLNSLRIQSATKLLSETDKSVTEIVFEAGYNNVAHFNKTFKKLVGVTPTEYRKGNSKESGSASELNVL